MSALWKSWKGWLTPMLLLGTMAYALAEDLTLTTYYPSPRGVYNELRTTGKVSVGSLDPHDPSARLEVVENINQLTGIAIINSSTGLNAGSALFFRTTPTGGTNGLISTCTAGDCNGPDSLNAMVLRETGPIILESQPANAAASLQFRAGTPGALGGTSPERMRIDQNGNIGIGMGASGIVSAQLHVQATNDINHDAFRISYPNTDPLLRVRPNGKVGVNVPSPNDPYGFDINDDLILWGNRQLIFRQQRGAVYQHAWEMGDTSTSGQTGFRIRQVFANDGTSVNQDRLVIEDNGFVGIGTTAPASRLVVQGSGADQTTSALNVTNSAGQSSLLVGDDGNVGIGTTTPARKLDVAGTIRTSESLEIQPNTSSRLEVGRKSLSDPYGYILATTGISGHAAGMKLQTSYLFGGSTLIRDSMTISSLGDVNVFGTVTAQSDARLKTNIAPMVDPLGKLEHIHGVSFERIDRQGETRDEGKRELGVLAQEVETVFPELVVTAADGYKAVDYLKLPAVLLEAIKELKRENDALRGRLEAVEAQLKERSR